MPIRGAYSPGRPWVTLEHVGPRAVVHALTRTALGGRASAKLREQGIIVRHFGKPERIADYLRITVGTVEQNQALIEALDTLL